MSEQVHVTHVEQPSEGLTEENGGNDCDDNDSLAPSYMSYFSDEEDNNCRLEDFDHVIHG